MGIREGTNQKGWREGDGWRELKSQALEDLIGSTWHAFIPFWKRTHECQVAKKCCVRRTFWWVWDTDGRAAFIGSWGARLEGDQRGWMIVGGTFPKDFLGVLLCELWSRRTTKTNRIVETPNTC